jgi:hypothetical protein
MPRTMPAGIQAWMKNQGSVASVLLTDIQTSDGTNYFWADVEGTYPSLITGANQFYCGWAKLWTSFVISRDLSTNAGDFTVQNISGNTIDRDVAAALKNHEFEGALCIMRLWLPLFDASMISFHGSLSEQEPKEEECVFRHLQLFDSTQYDVADDLISELCPWRFKSVQCGSTGSATTCDKLFTTCAASDHLAQEHFSGVLTIVPNVGVSTPSVGAGGGGGQNPDPGPVSNGGGVFGRLQQ